MLADQAFAIRFGCVAVLSTCVLAPSLLLVAITIASINELTLDDAKPSGR
jgi:hypothetical protein